MLGLKSVSRNFGEFKNFDQKQPQCLANKASVNELRKTSRQVRTWQSSRFQIYGVGIAEILLETQHQH